MEALVMIAARPDLILDNGGDLFAKCLDAPYDGLRAGTEETTSGRMRLEPLRDRLKVPILVINDSPIKQFAENEHAVGQSALESYLRPTSRLRPRGPRPLTLCRRAVQSACTASPHSGQRNGLRLARDRM
jgi:S-adenosylhomocysteine hydrolase